MFTVAHVLGTRLLSTCFVKSLRNTHRTHTEYDSLYWLLCSIWLFNGDENLIDLQDQMTLS